MMAGTGKWAVRLSSWAVAGLASGLAWLPRHCLHSLLSTSQTRHASAWLANKPSVCSCPRYG